MSRHHQALHLIARIVGIKVRTQSKLSPSYTPLQAYGTVNAYEYTMFCLSNILANPFDLATLSVSIVNDSGDDCLV